MENTKLRQQLAYDRSQRSETAGLESITVLRSIIDAAKTNIGRSKNAYRFKSTLKQWFSYIYTVSGRFAYEVLEKNLGCAVPSITTVRRTVSHFSCKVSEGVFRFKQLKEYLLENNFPLTVWISEDATRITSRVQYDSCTNQIVGFVPQLDENGIPVSNSFPAISAEKITSYFDSCTRATNVYTVMAQPVYDKSAAFALCLALTISFVMIM